ncbi:hypothetical protein [Streptomyces sp. UH6]|uniref:hypothetical protein n=1 Tax=Streptomyces sp. UH6 TaxID=2748379 RepID=UPI0015D49BD5|nr:hypothetical protein [Streptomyces sp. UH6]NYV72998.1 hypothetical protein [Streptomyces sp. UH6]
MLTALSALAVALVTAIGGIATAMVGRRRPRSAERRDDFTVVTERMDREIARQTTRIDELEADAERDRERIAVQDHTIRYLATWVRSLVAHVRLLGSEPPSPPQPVPEDAQQYLHDVGL